MTPSHVAHIGRLFKKVKRRRTPLYVYALAAGFVVVMVRAALGGH